MLMLDASRKSPIFAPINQHDNETYDWNNSHNYGRHFYSFCLHRLHVRQNRIGLLAHQMGNPRPVYRRSLVPFCRRGNAEQSSGLVNKPLHFTLLHFTVYYFSVFRFLIIPSENEILKHKKRARQLPRSAL